MDRATRYGLLSVKYQIWVGEVDRKEGIVLFHGGTEEHRTLCLHQQFESRQEARPFMIETLRAREHLVNIPVPIKHREGLALFQHFRAPSRQ
jgi:hypothetical protein